MANQILYWTRSQADWPEDQALFGPLSSESLSSFCHLPCVAFTKLNFSLPRRAFHQVIVTSTRSVDWAWQSPVLRPMLQRLPCHAFGQITLAKLREKGCKTLAYEVESGEALAHQFQGEGAILYIGPETSAFDFAGYFQAQGRYCYQLALYQTQPLVMAPPELVINGNRIPDGVICFASPSAVKAFLKRFAGDNLKALAIGATTAKACEGFFLSVDTAPEQTLSSLSRLALAQIQPE